MEGMPLWGLNSPYVDNSKRGTPNPKTIEFPKLFNPLYPM